MNQFSQADLLVWPVFAACLVLSFVLSGMEAGVFALSRLRIRQQQRAGRRSAQLLHRYLEHPENFLWTILVGNTLANFVIVGWLIVVIYRVFGDSRVLFVLAFSAAVFLLYALFDLLPKVLFRTYPNRLCITLVRPFRFIHVLLRPLVGLVEWVSGKLLIWRGGKAFTGTLFGNREELLLLMQETAQGLSSEERTMIRRVLELQTRTVLQVMTPLEQVVMVEAGGQAQDILSLAREKRLTRFPVVSTAQGQRRIIGLVNVDSILFRENLDPTRPVEDFIVPALFIDADLRLETAMRRMQRAGQRLAMVLDRDRREIGIISLQDILKTMFGEVAL